MSNMYCMCVCIINTSRMFIIIKISSFVKLVWSYILYICCGVIVELESL